MSSGKVFLIGAGPGDIELLTLKAVRCLQQLDIALIDDLVNPDIASLLPAGCEIVPVGKRGGCQSARQSDIEARLLAEARAGRRVGRIKGGDPFIFGRGGEEMQTLHAAGITVEVINGLTAALAVPATLGIPLTHRAHVHGVTLVSGHTHQGDEPNWHQLARSGTTLVIYMGMSRLAHICQQLQAAGMDTATPAAAIQHGTLPQQRQVVGTLASLPTLVEAAALGSPALLVIGPTVALADPKHSVIKESA